MFSLKNVKKPLVLLCFRSKVLKKHWFYCVFAQTYWKTIGFTMFSFKRVEKPLVLLCFRSTMLTNHWFYCVFVQTCWKTIGFTMFSLNVEKALVLQCSLCKFFKASFKDSLIRSIDSIHWFEDQSTKNFFGSTTVQKKIEKSEKTICFSREKFSHRINED